jgi:hypothetical protein
VDIPAPTKIRPLLPQGRGKWRTRDGKFDLVEDPRKDSLMGIGEKRRMVRHAWFIYPAKGQHPGVDDAMPVFVKQSRAWKSLGAAVTALEDALREGKPIDVHPSD